MKLSILIPVGSVHEYFVEAIKSVLDDAPRNSEVLICATAEVIAHAKTQLGNLSMDQRLKFVKSEHGDIVTNLNSGLSIAKGEYIARMDTDDVVIPTRFSKQIAYLDKIRNADVVGSYLQYICPHGVNKGLQDYPSRIKRSALGLASPKVAHPSVMMRRSILEALGMYSSEYPHVEDLELWLRVLREGEIHNITKPLLKYRLHPGQISRKQSDEQLKNSLLAFVNDFKFISKLPLINPQEFSELDLEEFFLYKETLIHGLGFIRRTILDAKFQEKYLERFLFSQVHQKNAVAFLVLESLKEARGLISKNLIGFFLIVSKIYYRHLITKFTWSGRRATKLRQTMTEACKECSPIPSNLGT